MPWIKNVEVKPVGGGSIVKYDYLDKGGDAMDHMHVLSTPKLVFESDDKAMKFARALTNNKTNLDFFTTDGDRKADILQAKQVKSDGDESLADGK